MSGLKLSVKSVQETPSRFELECDSGWWARTRETMREYEVELSRPFHLSLTGYRVGSIVAGQHLVEQVTKLMDTISICASRIAQDAAVYALAHLWPWAREKATMMRERRAALEAVFESGNLGFELISTGAYFAYVRHPFRGEPAQAVARRLAEEAAVLCLPGSVFGPQQEDYLRLAFANLEAGRMDELGDRLRGAG